MQLGESSLFLETPMSVCDFAIPLCFLSPSPLHSTRACETLFTEYTWRKCGMQTVGNRATVVDDDDPVLVLAPSTDM